VFVSTTQLDPATSRWPPPAARSLRRYGERAFSGDWLPSCYTTWGDTTQKRQPFEAFQYFGFGHAMKAKGVKLGAGGMLEHVDLS
jgi:hypothetical protein